MITAKMVSSLTIPAMCACLAACSGDESQNPPSRDTGIDALSAQDADDAGFGEDVDVPDVSVDMGFACERGTYPTGQPGQCSSLAGCSSFTLTRDDLGCVFFPNTAGRLTTAECETDADCVDSSYGPNCILRVCHEAEPCQQKEDCEDGLDCIKDSICMPPRSPCTMDADCERPAVCFSLEGLCG